MNPTVGAPVTSPQDTNLATRETLPPELPIDQSPELTSSGSIAVSVEAEKVAIPLEQPVQAENLTGVAAEIPMLPGIASEVPPKILEEIPIDGVTAEETPINAEPPTQETQPPQQHQSTLPQATSEPPSSDTRDRSSVPIYSIPNADMLLRGGRGALPKGLPEALEGSVMSAR